MARLFNETGHNSISERNTEAGRYIDELKDYTENMNDKNRQFIESLVQKQQDNELSVSPRQLFWLRDLYQEYCC